MPNGLAYHRRLEVRGDVDAGLAGTVARLREKSKAVEKIFRRVGQHRAQLS